MPRQTAELVIEIPDSLPPLEQALSSLLTARQPVVLDSSAIDPCHGRYCILACEPAESRAWTHGVNGSAFDALEGWIAATPSVAGSEAKVPFVGGWIGYVGYEAGRWLERLPAATGAHRLLPTAWFGCYDTAAVYDRIHDQWTLVAVDWPEGCRLATRPSARVRLAELLRQLGGGAPKRVSGTVCTQVEVQSDFSRPQYERAVQRVIDYIAAGDVFQVNLAQRLVVRRCEDAEGVFLRLRRRNPSCYGAFLKVGETAIVSASPELFFRLRDGRVVTRPIKGTRPRSADPVLDASLRRELYHSEKDRAELAMIIDLERNDLGRVCQYGTVRVTEAAALEQHPTVHHLVGTVEGRLREGHGAIDLLRAAFPGGSITGAPKIRAMEIIDELEPVPRGVYCGSIGCIGLDGSATFNIAIRTIMIGGGAAEVYAGGGIVADSTPTAEYDETLAKAAALLDALGVAGSAAYAPARA